ncbi:hypothetical protein Tco_1099121, partial [Tanacetum coccineum]
PGLATRVSALEIICANFEKNNKLKDKTIQALSPRVYTLENHDLYSKINKYVNEVVKEAIHNALQAPIRKRFRDLSEFELKEILCDRIFKGGSYRSHPEHTTLYEALKASMDHENREEFNEEMAKSRKRRCDDQDPPPPPPKDFDQSKKKRHDSDASASKQSPVQKSLACKTSDTREAPCQLLQEKGIPPNDLSETENNWADVLAKMYKDSEENKLLQKTRDMGSFINWYCKQIRKSNLVKADLEGPAYKLVKPFHKNSISLLFQTEECYLLLTYQVNLMNPEGNQVVHDISKPLPLGGPPGDKERRNALSISKLKAAYYPDFGLEELVPSLWIGSERGYDISAAYGKLNHLSGANKVHLFNAVNLWIGNIVIRQRVKYFQLGIKSYQTKLNLTQPRWDATDILFKEYYTIVHKPRAVIYRDRNDQKKMMQEIEVHKFSDGTLIRILEKLDYMVKDYKLFKFNPGMENRIWTEDDK